MWQWLTDNHGAVSAFTSILMLGVWMAYLQLFYVNFRHQVRPRILINRGAGHTTASRCIITNMSPETVYVDTVVIEAMIDGEMRICSLSDLDRLVDQAADRRTDLFQGPVGSGEYLDLGPYGDLIALALARGEDETLSDVDAVTLTLVGSYIWRDQLVAATRTFDLDHTVEGPAKMVPRGIMTRQIRSARERRMIRKMLIAQSGA